MNVQEDDKEIIWDCWYCIIWMFHLAQWQLLFLAWKRDSTYQQLGMCKIFWRAGFGYIRTVFSWKTTRDVAVVYISPEWTVKKSSHLKYTVNHLKIQKCQKEWRFKILLWWSTYRPAGRFSFCDEKILGFHLLRRTIIDVWNRSENAG